ncbi:uncharacterized protein LOC122511555 [Leptopilina heterotoma]|uniref:uncharacterized protein LOC122511555 n=1 Tax=Leptopilina heterotoma TaxID=63436 RepID=UPI001CA94301|nr:uncharacterized protein LOC122511555 [Leptopilina heterotoma]
MKSIVLLGNIVTIILVTLPAFKTIRISDDEREAEFLKLQTLRQKVNRHFNYNINMSILREFVLSRNDMYDFAEYLNQTGGQTPEWSKSRRLVNPELYELLRFNNYVDSIPSSANEMTESLTNLKNRIFENSPNVSFEQICYDYMKENLYELISFENYFAIRVLEEDYNQIELENLVGWRMKKALYSLAIRQYSQNSASNFLTIYCHSKHLKSRSFIDTYEMGETFKILNFRLCSSKRSSPEIKSKSSIMRMNNFTSYWIFYEFMITDPKLIVYLEDVIKSNDEKIYIFLPETRFKVINGPEVYNTNIGLAAFLKLRTIYYPRTLRWLAEAANNIEMYEKKEKEYYVEFFQFLDDLDI